MRSRSGEFLACMVCLLVEQRSSPTPASSPADKVSLAKTISRQYLNINTCVFRSAVLPPGFSHGLPGGVGNWKYEQMKAHLAAAQEKKEKEKAAKQAELEKKSSM